MNKKYDFELIQLKSIKNKDSKYFMRVVRKTQKLYTSITTNYNTLLQRINDEKREIYTVKKKLSKLANLRKTKQNKICTFYLKKSYSLPILIKFERIFLRISKLLKKGTQSNNIKNNLILLAKSNSNLLEPDLKIPILLKIIENSEYIAFFGLMQKTSYIIPLNYISFPDNFDYAINNQGMLWSGGFQKNENAIIADTFYMNFKNSEIQIKKSMNEPKAFHSLLCLSDGSIMSVGGRNIEKVLNTCELYDFKFNSWESFSSLNYERANCSGSQLENKVYIIGGRISENSLTEIIEECNLEDQIPDWQIINLQKKSILFMKESLFSISITKDEILIFGGGNGQNLATSSYIFEKKGNIKYTMDLPNTNFDPECKPAKYKNKVYLWGPVDNLYIFEIKNSRWNYVHCLKE